MFINKDSIAKFKKTQKDLVHKISQLPEDFSNPKNPKFKVSFINEEGDIKLEFSQKVKINLPCYQKCGSIEYDPSQTFDVKPQFKGEFHYKETNYFLEFY